MRDQKEATLLLLAGFVSVTNSCVYVCRRSSLSQHLLSLFTLTETSNGRDVPKLPRRTEGTANQLA